MNFIQRMALKVAGIPDTPATKTLGMPSWWADIRSTSGIGQGGQFGFDDNGLVGAVRSNVWAYNSVKARMTMVATPKLKLYKGEGDEREEIETHPVLDLLRFVNPINLNQRSLLRGIEQQLATFGRCVIHKNRGSSTPVELFILPKPYVKVIPDPKVFIKGYRWLPTGEIVDPKDIIDIYYPAVDGGVEAESPTAVALGAINRYNIADRAQTAVDKRGGQKGGLVIHPDQEIEEDFERIKDEWDKRRADPDKAGADMHVPHGTEYQGDAFSAVEMQREERISRLAKEIMAGYGIPPAAAGDYTDASVLANAAVQMKAAWDLFGLEELNFIAEGLTNSLLWAEYKDAAKGGWYLAFDTSTINALNEDVDAKTNRAVVVYTSQIASLNEARNLAGLDAIDDPMADKVPMAGATEPSVNEDAGEDPMMEDQADPEMEALNAEVDSILAEVSQAAGKAFDSIVYDEAKHQRDASGHFIKKSGDGPVTPRTGRPLTSQASSKPKGKGKKPKKTDEEKAKEKEAKAQAKMQEKAKKLDEDQAALTSAFDQVKDNPNVPEKLKQKLSKAIEKVKQKRVDLALGKKTDATSSLISEANAAAGKAIPIIDPVGHMAIDEAGTELGVVTKVARFNIHNMLEATAEDPVIYIGDKVYKASTLKVVVDG